MRKPGSSGALGVSGPGKEKEGRKVGLGFRVWGLGFGVQGLGLLWVLPPPSNSNSLY